MFQKTLVDDVWYGQWHYTGDLRYVTLSADGFQSYTQEPVTLATLRSFNSFFVQSPADGYLSFQLAHRAQSAPAKRTSAQSDDVEPVELSSGITLSQNGAADHAGILIGEAFTAGYDYNADLAKLFGSSQGLSLYLIGGEAMPLAYMALPVAGSDNAVGGSAAENTLREIVVPVGYRGATAADMTFDFDALRCGSLLTADAVTSIDAAAPRIEALLLHDHLTGAVTDLMLAPYTCRAVKAADDTRFTLSVRYSWHAAEEEQQTQVATSIDKTCASSNGQNAVYDVLGRRVLEAEEAPCAVPAGVYIIVEDGNTRKEVIR